MTDEQIFEIADPFGSFEYGDAQGHKRVAYARAIEAASVAPLLERITQKQDRIDQLIQEVAAGADAEAAQRDRIAALEAKLAQAPNAQQAEAQEPQDSGMVTPRHFTDEQVSRAMDGRGWWFYGVDPGTPLFTLPQPAQLQALSEEELKQTLLAFSEDSSSYEDSIDGLAKCIGAALAAKNGVNLK